MREAERGEAAVRHGQTKGNPAAARCRNLIMCLRCHVKTELFCFNSTVMILLFLVFSPWPPEGICYSLRKLKNKRKRELYNIVYYKNEQ